MWGMEQVPVRVTVLAVISTVIYIGVVLISL